MIHIENMRPWEKVLEVVKRHWIVYVMLFFNFIIWILVSILMYYSLSSHFFAWFPIWSNTFSLIIVILFWQWFAIILYIQWLNHELDMYVVTNNRVIWIDQISFLNRTVSECNLWQIQEVNSKTAWLFANIFNYWTLSIQTAWNITTLKMDFCPDSMQIARKILNIVDDYRDKNNIKNNTTLES